MSMRLGDYWKRNVWISVGRAFLKESPLGAQLRRGGELVLRGGVVAPKLSGRAIDV